MIDMYDLSKQYEKEERVTELKNLNYSEEIWYEIYDILNEAMRESIIEEKKLLEGKDKNLRTVVYYDENNNKVKRKVLREDLEKKLKRKYDSYSQLLNQINSYLKIIIEFDSEERVFGDIKILKILRNLPKEMTRSIINALKKDYEIYNDKMLDACDRLNAIFEAKVNNQFMINANGKKKLLFEDIIYEYKEQINEMILKKAFNIDYIGSVDEIYNQIFREIITSGKKLRFQNNSFDLIATEQDENEIYNGKVEIFYNAKQEELIEIKNKCDAINEKKLIGHIDEYIELYNQKYVYEKVLDVLYKILQGEKDFFLVKSNLENTFNEIEHLKNLLTKRVEKISDALSRKLSLINLYIEKKEAILKRDKKVDERKVIFPKDANNSMNNTQGEMVQRIENNTKPGLKSYALLYKEYCDCILKMYYEFSNETSELDGKEKEIQELMNEYHLTKEDIKEIELQVRETYADEQLTIIDNFEEEKKANMK